MALMSATAVSDISVICNCCRNILVCKDGAESKKVIPPNRLSYILKCLASVRLCPLLSQRALTLYPATDCAAATDISGVSGRWQLSR